MTNMTRSLYLSNVRLADDQAVSVSVVDGRIEALGANVSAPPGAHVEDGGGALLLPGFVEGHTHIDKSNWGRPWYRNEVGPLLTDRISNEREWRKTSGHDAAAQSLALSRAFVQAGTTRLRTHVDIDTDARLRYLEGVLATRQTMRDTLEMQIVALIVQGCKNKEIASQLGTKEQVIKNYLRGIYDKTGVSDRLELALFTIHHRVLAEAAAKAGNLIEMKSA